MKGIFARCFGGELQVPARLLPDAQAVARTVAELATHFYARVSSQDQVPKSQVEAAIARGISPANIHVDVASGAAMNGPC